MNVIPEHETTRMECFTSKNYYKNKNDFGSELICSYSYTLIYASLLENMRLEPDMEKNSARQCKEVWTTKWTSPMTGKPKFQEFATVELYLRRPFNFSILMIFNTWKQMNANKCMERWMQKCKQMFAKISVQERSLKLELLENMYSVKLWSIEQTEVLLMNQWHFYRRINVYWHGELERCKWKRIVNKRLDICKNTCRTIKHRCGLDITAVKLQPEA